MTPALKPKALVKPRKVAPLAKKGETFELSPPPGSTKPAKPKRTVSAFSLYPDLHLAISMLSKRQTQVAGHKAELVGQWVTDLNRIQAEITRLQRLEGLTEAVKRPTSNE